MIRECGRRLSLSLPCIILISRQGTVSIRENTVLQKTLGRILGCALLSYGSAALAFTLIGFRRSNSSRAPTSPTRSPSNRRFSRSQGPWSDAGNAIVVENKFGSVVLAARQGKVIRARALPGRREFEAKRVIGSRAP